VVANKKEWLKKKLTIVLEKYPFQIKIGLKKKSKYK